MKNLTIKKVALGLLLAGYAASGAFAVTTATTKQTIKGSAPVIKSNDEKASTNKYTVQVYRKTGDDWNLLNKEEKMKVGDKITISFKYSDGDGDKPVSDWTTTDKKDLENKSLKFEVTINDNDSTPISVQSGYTNVTMNEAGVYEYIIPKEAGRKMLNISLTPISQFGDPYYGARLKGNLFSGSYTDGPSIPPGCADESKTACILPSDDNVVVRIVKGSSPVLDSLPLESAWYGSSGDDTIPEENIPHVGDTFTYVVVDKSGSKEENITSLYPKASWYFTGENNAALGTVKSDSTKKVERTSYTIGVNAADEIAKLYTTKAPEAGAQGYNLAVTVTPE